MSNKQSINNQAPKIIDALPSTTACLIRNVIRANEIGMIVESSCAFDVGSSMSFGFHVSTLNQDRHRDSEFIYAEGLVVDSQKLLLTTDRESYRITVLYSDISNKDRSRLIKFTRSTKISSRMSNIGLN